MSGGPLPAAFAPLTIPASWCYGRAVAWRNRRFDEGDRTSSLPVATISVGNLTVGGTGKTPLVAWIVSMLRARGRHPLIAMRGYKARAGEPGDEEREYRLLVPEVPVVAHPKRHEAVSAHLASHPDEVDVVVLDDGFQHRQLARDFDLVLIDAKRPGLESRLLPAGWLREPPSSLARATAVVVTRADSIDDALARRIAAWHGHWPVAWCCHEWRGLDLHGGGGDRRELVGWLRGKRVFGVFGTGNPDAVRDAYQAAGATVVATANVADHAEYSPGFAAGCIGRAESLRCDAIATTRKDWTKLVDLTNGTPIPWVVPDVGIAFVAGEAELSRRLVEAATARR